MIFKDIIKVPSEIAIKAMRDLGGFYHRPFHEDANRAL